MKNLILYYGKFLTFLQNYTITTMRQSLKVLIVDDHPLIIHNYKSALTILEEENIHNSFLILTAEDCESARYEINKANEVHPLDLLLLDISLPPSKDKKLLCGEDIGKLARKTFPEIKIVILTSHNDNYRLNNILKSINPEGFLIKEDIDFKELIHGLKTVISDPPYYSKTIVRLLRKHYSSDFVLDEIDRQLLYNLSSGVKMKDLPDIIPMSIGGIERRKRKLKSIFNVNKQSDDELIRQARERGYI